MGFLAILKNWKESLMAAMAAIIAGLYLLNKSYRSKNKKLTKQVDGFEEGEEIEQHQKEAKAKIDAEEDKEIYEELHADKSKSDSVDGW